MSSSTKFGMGQGSAAPPLKPDRGVTDISEFLECRMPRADSAESAHAFYGLGATHLAGAGIESSESLGRPEGKRVR